MGRSLQTALIALALAATLAVGAVGYYCCYALQEWAAVGTETATAASDLDATVKRLNGPTGTITEADKLILALKSTTVHADLAIAHEDKQLEAYDRYSKRLFDDVDGLAQRGGRTLDATTGTLHQARTDLETLNGSLAQIEPLIDQTTATVADLQSLTPDIGRTAKATGDSMEQAAGIAASVNKMAATAERKVDAKPTWKSRVLDYAGPAAKIIAWLLKYWTVLSSRHPSRSDLL
jgi:hypothetical protein